MASKLMHKVRNQTAKMCNCAGCGRVLLGACHAEEYHKANPAVRNSLPPPVAGRVSGRPGCSRCLTNGTLLAVVNN